MSKTCPKRHASGTCPPCTGNCRQGDECPAEPPPREPMKRRDLGTVLVLIGATWVLVVFVVRLAAKVLGGAS